MTTKRILELKVCHMPVFSMYVQYIPKIFEKCPRYVKDMRYATLADPSYARS